MMGSIYRYQWWAAGWFGWLNNFPEGMMLNGSALTSAEL
jgi:hypothetical protein